MDNISKLKMILCSTEDEYKEVTVVLESGKGTVVEQTECVLVGKILANKVLNRGAVKSIVTKA